ncbi:MAG: DUF427 domain-containing protein [Bacteroidota bacterium]
MDKKKIKVQDWLLKARNKWTHIGQQRPDFAIVPKKGQVSVWDFPRPPALVAEKRELKVLSNGQTLALSQNALAVQETASPPTYYVPLEDVNRDLLVPLEGKTSLCEWKGSSSYWALKEQPNKAVAWSYADPFSPFEALTQYFAFYPQYLECFLAGERVIPQPGGFYAGWITGELVGPFKGEPGTGHW